MTLEEQYKLMFPRRLTSKNFDLCKSIGCKNHEDCAYPCHVFDMYVRLTTLENLIY